MSNTTNQLKQMYWLNNEWVHVDAENANNLDMLDSTDFASRITEKLVDHSNLHFLIGNNDWSSLIYTLKEGSTPAAVYSQTEKGVIITGSDQHFGIHTHIPTDLSSEYFIKIKIKKLRGDGNFSCGIIKLNNEYKKIGDFDYILANNINIQTQTILQSKYRNAESNYLDIVCFTGQNATDKNTQFVIQSIEFYRIQDTLQLASGEVWHPGNFDPSQKADISFVEDKMTYTNDMPILTAIGDIAVGDTFDKVSFYDLFTRMLYPYVAPILKLAGTVNTSIREYGVPLTNVKFTATATKKSRPLTSIKFYKDSQLLYTVPTVSANGGAYVFNCTTPLTTSCLITAKVEDGRSVITSNGIRYTFVYPIYIGQTEIASPIETVIKSFEKRVVTKANQEKIYTLKDQRFCIAYPASYGSLKSILDANQFEILSDFEKKTLPMTMADKTTQNYYVYTFKNLVEISNFKVSFKF